MNVDKNTNTTTSKQEHTLQQQPIEKKSRKKCHGNAKLQRFRKRCRARGMNAKAITNLINKRNRINGKPTTTKKTNNTAATVENMETTVSNVSVQVRRSSDMVYTSLTSIEWSVQQSDDKIGSNMAESNKRKRDSSSKEQKNNVAKSSSQWSIVQPSPKKKTKVNMNKSSTKVNNISVNNNYRYIYLFYSDNFG
jgi:hypothetical protein